jgi:hypothetical protein
VAAKVKTAAAPADVVNVVETPGWNLLYPVPAPFTVYVRAPENVPKVANTITAYNLLYVCGIEVKEGAEVNATDEIRVWDAGVVQVGVAPDPAEVSTCPVVPAEPFKCIGLVVES